MARPRTVNAKIPGLPRGMRKVGSNWYWRPTDAGTRLVAEQLTQKGIGTKAGATPKEAANWWATHVSPALEQLTPSDTIKGTMEEIFRLYESDELPTIKRKDTRDEYATHIRRLRRDFGAKRYPRTESEAMQPGYLRDVDVQKNLHLGRDKPYAANRRISLMSRMFRLAKVRWGLTAYNPCADIEYLPEHARDVYVDDKKFVEVTDAGSEIFKLIASISQQTSARVGSVYAIRLSQIKEDGLAILVGKKKNAKGYIEQLYKWTPDLRATIDRALELRAKAPGTADRKDANGPLFLNRFGKGYTKEAYKSAWARVKKAMGLGARELTVHDLGRAKAISDSDGDIAGQELAGHESVGVTKRHYRRKARVVTPVPAVKKKGH